MKKSKINNTELASFEELKDKYLGKPGTKKRDEFEMEVELESFGENIKTLRKRCNLTQEELGKLIGVQRAQISKLEKESRNMTLETMLKILKALNVKLKLELKSKNRNSLELVN